MHTLIHMYMHTYAGRAGRLFSYNHWSTTDGQTVSTKTTQILPRTQIDCYPRARKLIASPAHPLQDKFRFSTFLLLAHLAATFFPIALPNFVFALRQLSYRTTFCFVKFRLNEMCFFFLIPEIIDAFFEWNFRGAVLGFSIMTNC